VTRPSWAKSGLWLLLAAGLVLGLPGLGQAKVIAAKKCLKCHAELKKMDNVVAGDFQSRSHKASSIAVKVAPGKVQVIKFTAQTKVKNVPSIKKLRKPIPVQVHYVKRGHDLVATEIVAKPVIKVPKDQLIDVKQMAALVKKGGFTLVDSRPAIRYQEGHIPGAISIPFPKMPELMHKLPKDKNALIVFYCGGFR